MKSRQSAFIFLVLIGALTFASELKTDIVRKELVGTALDKDSQIFYLEKSTLTYNQGKLENIDTQYTSKDGKLIAESHSSLKKNSYLPDVSMKDFRDQYEYQIVYLPDEKKVEISQKNDAKSEWARKKISYSENMTNSVGLMNYIKDHAADIKTEKRKVFRYIIPSRQDDYGMIVEYLSEDKNILHFQFKIENSLIRSLAGTGENHVNFDLNTSQITEFKGVAILLDEKDKSVNITLSYLPLKLISEKAGK